MTDQLLSSLSHLVQLWRNLTEKPSGCRQVCMYVGMCSGFSERTGLRRGTLCEKDKGKMTFAFQ